MIEEPEVFNLTLLDRKMFPDLTNKQWKSLCDEVKGRVDNFLDEIIERIVEVVRSEN
jgi:hypothetical protein